MSECTVSAVLIVKNADKYLLKCIQSLEKKMDEIIIVDTGSTDESKKIEMQIKNKKIHIFNYIWNDDFAKARNYAWGKATKKWVLWIDSDERLITPRDDLVNQIEKMNSKSYEIGSVLISDAWSGNEIPTPKLVLNDTKRFNFFGVVHEEIRCCGSPIGSINAFNTDIRLKHYGYTKETLKSKATRNVVLLKKMLIADPKNPRWIYFLGRDGMKICDEDFLIQRTLKAVLLRNSEYQLGLIENLIKLYFKKEDMDNAKKWIISLHDEFPNCMDYEYFDVLYYIQRCCMKRERLITELVNFRRSILDGDNKYSLLNSKGLHLDSEIAYLLFQNGKYNDADKFYSYLEKNNHVDPLVKKQKDVLNKSEMKNNED